jgi:hypothetical protein
MKMLQASLMLNGLDGVECRVQSCGESFSFDDDVEVCLVKVDIEGNENHFINGIEKHLQAGKIHNLILEISPALADNYVELCKRLRGYGFKIYDIGLSPQRKLADQTRHLEELPGTELTDIKKFIEDLLKGEMKQTNFLFRKVRRS